MANNPIWPSSLPQRPMQSGWSRKPNNRLVVSPVDKGARKVRRRFTGRVDSFTAAYYMTKAQLATFESFFDVTIEAGALVFDLPDPEDAAEPPANITVRFRPEGNFYAITAAAAGERVVTLDMETIP